MIWTSSIELSKLKLGSYLKGHPYIFRLVAPFRATEKKVAVGRDTDIVIEGFWRCANHHAVFFFEEAQPRNVTVAHHFHAAAQVLIAIKNKIPVVVVTRRPRDAIASACVYLETEEVLPMAIYYRNFHRQLLNSLDKIVVSDFETTISDFGSIIELVNKTFRSNFSIPSDPSQVESRVRERIAKELKQGMEGKLFRDPAPSREKEVLKERIYKKLSSPAALPLIQECEDLYNQFVYHTIVQVDR